MENEIISGMICFSLPIVVIAAICTALGFISQYKLRHQSTCSDFIPHGSKADQLLTNSSDSQMEKIVINTKRLKKKDLTLN